MVTSPNTYGWHIHADDSTYNDKVEFHPVQMATGACLSHLAKAMTFDEKGHIISHGPLGLPATWHIHADDGAINGTTSIAITRYGSCGDGSSSSSGTDDECPPLVSILEVAPVTLHFDQKGHLFAVETCGNPTHYIHNQKRLGVKYRKFFVDLVLKCSENASSAVSSDALSSCAERIECISSADSSSYSYHVFRFMWDEEGHLHSVEKQQAVSCVPAAVVPVGDSCTGLGYVGDCALCTDIPLCAEFECVTLAMVTVKYRTCTVLTHQPNTSTRTKSDKWCGTVDLGTSCVPPFEICLQAERGDPNNPTIACEWFWRVLYNGTPLPTVSPTAVTATNGCCPLRLLTGISGLDCVDCLTQTPITMIIGYNQCL